MTEECAKVLNDQAICTNEPMPWQSLCVAVIKQAAMDFWEYETIIKELPKYKASKMFRTHKAREYGDAEEFLQSDDAEFYSTITDFKPLQLMNQIRWQINKEKKRNEKETAVV